LLLLRKLLINNKYVLFLKVSKLTNIQQYNNKLIFSLFLYQFNSIYLTHKFFMKYLNNNNFNNNSLLNLNFLNKEFNFLIIYTNNYFKLNSFLLDYNIEFENEILSIMRFLIKINNNIFFFSKFLKIFSKSGLFNKLNCIEFYKKFKCLLFSKMLIFLIMYRFNQAVIFLIFKSFFFYLKCQLFCKK
jgi:hypothetical protein